MKRSTEVFLLALAAMLPAKALAQPLTLAPALGDGAVLQRGQPITIAGQAEPGARVKIQLGEAVREATAGRGGSWSVTFPAMTATAALSLSADAGDQHLKLSNLAVGDVFLCSGQSNMQFSMGESALKPEERKLPIDRSIALLSVPIATARVERADFASPAQWTNAFADSSEFSAVCLTAGRTIAQSQNVPIGLVDASMGGTPIQAWLPYEGLKQAGGQEQGLAILDAFRSDPVAAEAKYGADLDAMWKMPPPPGQAPNRPRMGYAGLFNAMIAPLRGTRFAGVIWYQGENNANQANPRTAYRSQLTALLSSWRGRFGSGQPFVIVQLAPFGPLSAKPDENNWAEVREAQREVAEADPRAELVTTVDVGERLDIHPPLKKPVGQRAAAALSYMLYGGPIESLGPRPLAASRQGNAVRVSISGTGLIAASWGRPGPFVLCQTGPAPDCRFADARFTDGGVSIDVAEGFAPDRVRYCWGAAPICNVFDSAQQPLPAFELPIAAGR